MMLNIHGYLFKNKKAAIHHCNVHKLPGEVQTPELNDLVPSLPGNSFQPSALSSPNEVYGNCMIHIHMSILACNRKYEPTHVEKIQV